MEKDFSKRRDFVTSVANVLRRYSSLSTDVRFFIACQFALESDYGDSNLATTLCNYCGMKVPMVRLSVALNKGYFRSCGGFARYSSLSSCVDDYCLWLSYNRISLDAQRNLSNFKKFLVDSGYCPHSDYVSRIEVIFNQFF